MTDVEARKKVNGQNFEILVDVDKALQLKEGTDVNMQNVLAINEIFDDAKKGEKASSDDLEKAFGTSETEEVAKKIIKSGEIKLPAEYRKKKLEKKRKEVIDFLATNGMDAQTGKPISRKRIESALDDAGVNIEKKPVEKQVDRILSKLKEVIPIKIETKELKVTIPSNYTGKAYGLLQEYKQDEEWLANGDLTCTIKIPAGLQMEFYDKLNSMTQGSAIVEEVEQKV